MQTTIKAYRILTNYNEFFKVGLTEETAQLDFHDAHDALAITLLCHRGELIRAYAAASGMSEQQIEHDFEGGIDNWIGFGSVTCCELCCNTYVSLQADQIVVLIQP